MCRNAAYSARWTNHAGGGSLNNTKKPPTLDDEAIALNTSVREPTSGFSRRLKRRQEERQEHSGARQPAQIGGREASARRRACSRCPLLLQAFLRHKLPHYTTPITPHSTPAFTSESTRTAPCGSWRFAFIDGHDEPDYSNALIVAVNWTGLAAREDRAEPFGDSRTVTRMEDRTQSARSTTHAQAEQTARFMLIPAAAKQWGVPAPSAKPDFSCCRRSTNRRSGFMANYRHAAAKFQSP